MTRPRLLDLFCGAGGAAMGYHRAGFDVVGVDINPQPHYPFEFIQADIFSAAFDDNLLRGFDVIHASPPCQEVSSTRHLRDAQGKNGRTMNLIPETRELLRWAANDGIPYVIENVPRAPLLDPVWLCGSMFGLEFAGRPLRRHRGFESNVAIGPAPEDAHRLQSRPLGVYGSMRDDIPHGGQTVRSLDEGRALMGIDWMKWDELKESIPPAYTEWLGARLMEWMA